MTKLLRFPIERLRHVGTAAPQPIELPKEQLIQVSTDDPNWIMPPLIPWNPNNIATSALTAIYLRARQDITPNEFHNALDEIVRRSK